VFDDDRRQEGIPSGRIVPSKRHHLSGCQTEMTLPIVSPSLDPPRRKCPASDRSFVPPSLPTRAERSQQRKCEDANTAAAARKSPPSICAGTTV